VSRSIAASHSLQYVERFRAKLDEPGAGDFPISLDGDGGGTQAGIVKLTETGSHAELVKKLKAAIAR